MTALADGTLVDSTMAANGAWVLTGDQGNESFAGKTVAFQIDGVRANDTTAWIQGGGQEISLTLGAVGSAGVSGVAGVAGPAGARGATGATGSQGRRGAAGADGADGLDGLDGAMALRAPLAQPGQEGAKGPEGPGGAPGTAGPAGLAEDVSFSTLGVVALALAIMVLVGAGGAFMVRGSKAGSEALLNEVQSLREQLGEAQRLGGVRENLILAEYQAKAERWEEEGIDVAELRRLINAYESNR